MVIAWTNLNLFLINLGSSGINSSCCKGPQEILHIINCKPMCGSNSGVVLVGVPISVPNGVPLNFELGVPIGAAIGVLSKVGVDFLLIWPLASGWQGYLSESSSCPSSAAFYMHPWTWGQHSLHPSPSQPWHQLPHSDTNWEPGSLTELSFSPPLTAISLIRVCITPFFSYLVALPFFFYLVASPLFSFLLASPFFSYLVASPFFSYLVASPFFSYLVICPMHSTLFF